jgi:O-antigen/teichoic acid export membrane protein
MSNLKELLKQSSHYLVGRGASIAIGFVSFPIFARLLSVADYGILNLAQRFTTVAVAVGKLGMQNAIIRFHEETAASEGDTNRLYSTSFWGCMLGAAASSLLCVLALMFLPVMQGQHSLIRPLLVASALVFMRAAVSPIYSFLRVEGRTVAFNALDVATRLLSLIFGCSAILVLGRRPENMLLGLTLAEGIALGIGLAFLVRPKTISPRHFDFALLWSALKFALPLAGSELALMLLSSADRAFIQYYLGSEPLGYFAAASAIANVLQDAIQTPLNLALVPIYVKVWYTQGAHATSKLVEQSMELFFMAACALSAVVFAASREMMIFVSSAKYAPAAPMLPWLVVGYMIYTISTFSSAGFWIQKKTLPMAYLVACAFAFKCVLNVLMLRPFGLWGAVIPTIAGSAALVVLFGWRSHRLLPLHVSAFHCARTVALAAIGAYAGHLVSGPTLLLSLIIRSGTTLLTYGILLWMVDQRVRDGAALLAVGVMRKLRPVPV